jgi:uncharacterized protein (TIGR00290 family)
MSKAYMNWSGGKDSALCLYRVLVEKQFRVDCLLTSINSVHNRISMHGVRRELLENQARSIGISLQTIELQEQPSMAEYEETMLSKTTALKETGYTHAIFGDIFLEDLRQYREIKLATLEITGVFPLWKIPTHQLMEEFITLGFKGIVACVNENLLPRDFCGRLLDASFLQDLPANVDPCGENGEFHSFVFDGPIFSNPIPFQVGETVYRTYKAPHEAGASRDLKDQAGEYGFYFCDLIPESMQES